MTPTARRIVTSRLLGLRRAIHYTMSAASPDTRPPVAEIKAGTTPKVVK
jgi:hypothetical protein